jgi:hypothetical protein
MIRAGESGQHMSAGPGRGSRTRSRIRYGSRCCWLSQHPPRSRQAAEAHILLTVKQMVLTDAILVVQ